jgi:hypothetical protein
MRSNEIESFTGDVLRVIALLQDVSIGINAYWYVIDKACKRLSKHQVSFEAMTRRINDESFHDQSTVLTPSKFANWLLRP